MRWTIWGREIICAESVAELQEIRRLEKKRWVARDGERFVEFWVTYADPALGSVRISVPLLAHFAFQERKTAVLEQLKNLRPELLRHAPADIGWSVATIDDDAEEAEVMAACPDLTLAECRRFSYPAVFIVRCGTPTPRTWRSSDENGGVRVGEARQRCPQSASSSFDRSYRLLSWRLLHSTSTRMWRSFTWSKHIVGKFVTSRQWSLEPPSCATFQISMPETATYFS
jgi:hypothetical protein